MLTSYLALDVGEARIGLALANSVARLAAPLPAIANDEQRIAHLQEVITGNDVSVLIVGWPRNLDGEHTAQTEYVAQFIADVEKQLALTIHRQDEAVTSVQAENELRSRGKSYEKGDIDSLSAVYILEDFLAGEVH